VLRAEASRARLPHELRVGPEKNKGRKERKIERKIKRNKEKKINSFLPLRKRNKLC
jgi:hypothetical protein